LDGGPLAVEWAIAENIYFGREGQDGVKMREKKCGTFKHNDFIAF